MSNELPEYALNRDKTTAEDYRERVRQLAQLNEKRGGKTLVLKELRQLVNILEQLENYNVCSNCGYIRRRTKNGSTFKWRCPECTHTQHDENACKKAIKEKYGGEQQ